MCSRIALSGLVFLLMVLTATAGVEVTNGVVVLPSDDSIAPFNRPFNLAGRSLTFTRTGPESYSEQSGPLQFDDDRGTLLTLDRTTKSVVYNIAGFDFPFFGRTVRTLYVSQLLAIYLDVPALPPPLTVYQWGDAELIADGKAVIAPMLSTSRGVGSFLPPTVYVKEAADRVVITWWEDTRSLAVQAVLFSNGDIRFSYRSIARIEGGALIITSGKEAWRTLVQLTSADDPANDLSGGPASDADRVVDIRNVVVSRVGDTNVLQVAIKVGSPIDRTKLTGAGIGIFLNFGAGSSANATIGPNPAGDQVILAIGGQRTVGGADGSTGGNSWPVHGPSPAIQTAGDTITLTFAQELILGQGAFDGDVALQVEGGTHSDGLGFHLKIDVAPRQLSSDLASVSPVAAFPGAIVDSFVLPEFNPTAAWAEVQAALDLDPTMIDAVVFYQNYGTLTTYESAAFSTVGNPGVDNIGFETHHIGSDSPRSSSVPRVPNLMFMSRVGESFNVIDDFTGQVLMHEFGHRWLFYADALVGGMAAPINGDGAHPNPFLDTRAAFPVAHSDDCSVMGGETFVDNGDGTFTIAEIEDEGCGYGYSWLDLYLMGLAAPGEVPPFFYLSDPDPPDVLDSSDVPTFSAVRHDLTISNVTDRMGFRNPAWPNSQRVFKVLFVLVSNPSPSNTEIASVAHYAGLFRERFSVATGQRGAIDQLFYVPGPRRRAARP